MPRPSSSATASTCSRGRATREVLGALDADTGKVLWRATYPAAFTISPAAARHEKGPKATPTFADGKLFTLGMTGIVSAFDAATGKRLWQTASSQPGPLYHTAMSPLIDRGLAIVHVGSHGRGAPDRLRREHRRREVALGRRRPGLWLADRGGVRRYRQIITFTQDNLVGVSASTGALLWKRRFETNYTQNCITPLLYRPDRDRVRSRQRSDRVQTGEGATGSGTPWTSGKTPRYRCT